MRRSMLTALACTFIAGQAVAEPPHNVKLESEEPIQGYARVNKMLFGGLSGIDYDPQSKFWYAVSSDTGDSAPVRFFVLIIEFDEYGHMVIESDEVQKLNNPNGDLYEPGKHSPSSVRIIPPDPIGDEPYLVWTSEGVLDQGNKAGVFEMCTGATFMDGFKYGEYTDFIADEQGPRVDMAFESIALLPNMQVIAGYEQPLTQDGPVATTGSGTTYTRLIHLDYFKANQIGEMAYPLEEPSDSAVRSLVDLVAVDEDTLLAVENIEIPSDKRIRDVTTELYLVELGEASDIMGVESLSGLTAGEDFTPVSKTFLGDNETLGGLRRAPYRGVTFGPMFEDGRASIVLISNNDCDQYQNTYFALLSAEGIQPRRPFVKPEGRAYEARDITSERGIPQRIRTIRKQQDNEDGTPLGEG
ncbi:MAG: hypothetical protein Phyf2KO_16670 [Phycisphaerales bacterium]